MTIQVDFRELKSIIPQEIERLGVPIEVKTLIDGDYIVKNMCIERKEQSDYVSSLFSEHLKNQLYRLSTNFPVSYLITEGWLMQPVANMQTNRKVIIGSLASVCCKRSPDGCQGIINLITLDNAFDVALFLVDLHKQTEENEPRLPALPRVSYSDSLRQEFILRSFPTIGEVKSIKLLGKYGSIHNVFESITNKQEEVEMLIGKASFRSIYEWMHKAYIIEQQDNHTE